jgi:hypothetical protein
MIGDGQQLALHFTRDFAMADQLQQLLKECTVSVADGAGSRRKIFGCFVAPGRVVTADLDDGRAAPKIRWPGGGTVGDLQALDEAKAVQEPPMAQGFFRWLPPTFPLSLGIATLRFTAFKGHPCVGIDRGIPNPDDTLLISGESLIEALPGDVSAPDSLAITLDKTLPAIALNLTPAETDGRRNDDIQQAAMKGALDGAPVLNRRTGGVCGFVVGSSLILPWSAISAYKQPLVEANRKFHSRDLRWADALEADPLVADKTDRHRIMFDQLVNSRGIETRQDFADRLNEVSAYANLTIREIESYTRISSLSLAGYFQGQRLPGNPRYLRMILAVCGVHDPGEVTAWEKALDRVRRIRRAEPAAKGPTLLGESHLGWKRRDQKDAMIIEGSSPEDDPEQLLLRIYIPSERLYANEAARLLSLFREWLYKVRGQSVELHERHTVAGTMYEFFADGPPPGIDLRAQMDVFTHFLTLCAEDSSAAVDMLITAGMSSASSTELVQKFALQARRVQRDLKYEWQARMLQIQHQLEDELDHSGVDLRTLPSRQLTAAIETYVPGPVAEQSLALLASLQRSRASGPVTIQLNQQIVGQLAGTILQNVQGTMKFGLEAEALLKLIKEQASRDEAPFLEAAIHELEEPQVRPAVKLRAKRLLLAFLKEAGGIGRDVTAELLVKWLESKGA